MQSKPSAHHEAFGRIDAAHVCVVIVLFGFLVWATVLGGWRFGLIREFLVAVPASDKVGHALIYAAITFFAALVAKRPDRIRSVAWVVIGIGVIEEFRQLGEIGRAFTIGDLVANAVGVIAGVAGALLVLHRRKRPPQPVDDHCDDSSRTLATSH